jgi:hypothetical protein
VITKHGIPVEMKRRRGDSISYIVRQKLKESMQISESHGLSLTPLESKKLEDTKTLGLIVFRLSQLETTGM